MRLCGSTPTGAPSSGGDGRWRARSGASSEPGGRQGFVLDPILSLRRSIALGPGESARVSLIIAAGESRQGVLGLMDKYGDPHAIDRAMDFAWATAQLELRLLRIQPDEARRFQEMASHLLFPNPLLRPPAERIEENRKGQAGLWRVWNIGRRADHPGQHRRGAGYQPGEAIAPGAFLLAHARTEGGPGDPQRGGERLRAAAA